MGLFRTNVNKFFQPCLNCVKIIHPGYEMWHTYDEQAVKVPMNSKTRHFTYLQTGDCCSLFRPFTFDTRGHQVLNCAEMVTFTWSSSWCVSGHKSWFGSSNALLRLESNLELVWGNVESLWNLISTKLSGLSLYRFVYYHIIIFTAVVR